MYCSVCKLRVADDSVVTCPVCQGELQPESETGAKSEADDFVSELAAVFESGLEPDIKLEDKLDAYVRNDTNLEFDPEGLGLKSSEEDDPEASAEDIKVLADLWEKEDIGADLDGVFTDAFRLEEAVTESSPVGPGAIKLEKAAPEIPQMPTSDMSSPEILTPAPTGNSRKLGLPLLVLIALLVVGGGWFYMQNAGVKPENKLTQEIKSPAPLKPKIKLHPEPAVVNNQPIEAKMVPVVEKNSVAVVRPQPTGDEPAEISAGDKRNSVTDAEKKVAVADSVETAVDSPVISVATSLSAESPVAAGTDPSSIVEKKTLSESAAETVVKNQESQTPAAGKVVRGSMLSKKNAVVKFEKINPTAVPGVTATGPRYVVHIGSFRNEAGADRQLAKLQKKGFAAYKVEVDLGVKGVWQRIFVPGGVLKSDARLVQKQLAKSFPQEESLVRKIKK